MQGALHFQEFFRRATKYSPYFYQISLATADNSPAILDVPTGMGKTAAITLAWLWRRFVGEGVKGRTPEEIRSETPRKLVYCLPMRVLVEQTASCAITWVENLFNANMLPPKNKPLIYVLMGGEIDQDWDLSPEREAILIGTQDQLLSRALNRGYAMSRFRWPVHFGFLNNDCLWVMDEVQLMGPGLPTSIQLQGFRKTMATYGPASSIWMSDTIDQGAFSTIDSPLTGKDWSAVCLDLGADMENEEVKKRLYAKKLLKKASVVLATDNQKHYTNELASEVATLHGESKGLTIVILNRVRRAQETAQSLRKIFANSGNSTKVTLIHSRFRPHERQWMDEMLKDFKGQNADHVLVSTQAIEAGVDISASALITELAPWSSLVQRFGRLNRHGELTAAHAYWVDTEWKREEKGKIIEDPGLVLPYGGNDLDQAREQLTKLSDVSPYTLRGMMVTSDGKSYSLLRRKDIVGLFDTTPDLSGSDVDISSFIRDSDDMDVSVFWRKWDGGQPPHGMPAPMSEELCPVALYEVRDFLKDKEAWFWDALEHSWSRIDRNRLRPGLVLLVHCDHGGYDPDLGWVGNRKSGSVELVPPLQELPEEGTSDDPLTTAETYVTIAAHTSAVVSELESFLAEIKNTTLPASDLHTAALWHDRGKAHPIFQNAIQRTTTQQNGGMPENEIWAKAPHIEKYERPYFRHELASALAALLNGVSDLSAYLAAAHHGKVRLSIRSLPNEAISPQGERFARGVWEGDILPSVTLGNGVIAPKVALSLVLMEIGRSDQYGPSWLERSLRLLEQYGPFKLAFLESLIRVADWRASRS